MTNKKQKLLSGILTSVSALAVAGTVTGLVIGLNKNKSSHPQFLNGKTINFSAGEGSIAKNQPKSTTVESGTTFDRVDQPEVVSNNPRKIFGGWRDQNGELVRGNATVRKDMQLTASYNDANSSEYVTVLFALDPAQEGAVLQGNQRVSVNKGYYFFMVNRPTAKWTVTTAEGVVKQKYFKGWRYAGGEQVNENDKITSNVVLYPIFNEAVTVTWHADGTHEEGTPTGHGEIERGQDTTTLETNTIFNKFNQPALKYVYEPTTQTDKAYFAGWYKDQECKTEWNESEALTADADAYAKWAKEPEVGDQYGFLEFADARSTMEDGTKLPETLTFGWTPSSSIVVKLNDKTWGDTNKPSIVVYNDGVITNDYKVASWEIALGTKEEGKEPVYGEFTTLDDTYKFPTTTKYYKIRPVLQYAIDSITVYGDEKARVEGTIQYNVLIEGGSTSSQAVTWQLVTDDSGTDTPFPDGLAEISKSGLVTVKSISRDVWEQWGYNCFYVKATSQLDTSKRDYLKVSISMPYENNSYIWIHTESSESGNPKWYYADMDAFCDTSAPSVITYAYSDPTGATTHTFDKTVPFTDTITFGTDIGAIPDNFLAGWDNFQGNVDLKNSNVVLIGNEFMAGCTSFNNPLYLSNLTSIGANFLKDCTSYNTPITFNASAPLVEIGEAFLNGCTSFNSTLTLPTTYQLWISSGFMYNCTSFNQPLSLPSIIMYIGDFFMSDCNAFTSTLTTAVQMDRFVVSDGSLSSVDMNAEIYQTGFTVAGTQAENFKLYYKTIKGEHYRTIRTDAFDGRVTADQFNAAKALLASTKNFTAAINKLGTIYYDNSTSNDSEIKVKMTDPQGFDPIFVKLDTLDNTVMEHHYSPKGDYVGSEHVQTISSVYGKVSYLQGIVESAPQYSSTVWTFDEENKLYYTGEEGGQQLAFRFEQEKKNIDYVVLRDEGKVALAATVSNVGATKITDAPKSYNHMNAATLSSGTFSGSDPVAQTTSELTAFEVQIDKATADAKPTAFAIAAGEQGEESTYKVYSTVLFKKKVVSTDKAICHLNYTYSTAAKTFITELGSEDVFEEGDILVVIFYPGLTTKGSSFTARPVKTSTITFSHDSTGLLPDVVPYLYFDEAGQQQFDFGDNLTVIQKDAISFYLKLEHKTEMYNYLDTAKCTYQVGKSGSVVKFTDANSKITAADITPAEPVQTTYKLYKITVQADAITDATSINLVYGATKAVSNIWWDTSAAGMKGATSIITSFDTAGTQLIKNDSDFYFDVDKDLVFYVIAEGVEGTLKTEIDKGSGGLRIREGWVYVSWNDAVANYGVTIAKDDTLSTTTKFVYKFTLPKTFAVTLGSIRIYFTETI